MSNLARMSSSSILLVAVVLSVWGAADESRAFPSIRASFFATYPEAVGSRLDDLPSRSNHCGVCHYDFSGGGARNPFGQAVESLLARSPEASLSLGAMDSDGDGFSNDQEILDVVSSSNTPTFPGLTPANVSLVSNIDVADIEGFLVPTNDGDLSSDPAAPTSVVFSVGGNPVTGAVTDANGPNGDRDYITFTVEAGKKLTGLVLSAYDPDDVGFCAFNTGTTSFIPDESTNANFLSGILIGGSDVGLDLMPFFVDRAVTTNALGAPELGPGDYCFVIQQTSTALQFYSLEFIVTDHLVEAEQRTWSAVKNYFR